MTTPVRPVRWHPALPTGWAGVAAALVALNAVLVVPELRWWRWRWEVREHEIDIRRGLAGSLVSFATQFDALVVAEGIETESELQTLVELGFGYGQGFLLGAPGPLPLPERRR